jgi:hypothetical protein
MNDNDQMPAKQWAELVRRHPECRTARYRKAGSDVISNAIFDPARIPDPAAWLRERLGCDVVLVGDEG